MSKPRAVGALVVVLGCLATIVIAGWWFGSAPDRSLEQAEQAVIARDWPTAEALLTRHIARHPFDTHARVLLSRTYRRTIPDRLEEAERHLLAALQKPTTAPEVELEEMLLRCQKGSSSREVEGYLSGMLLSPRTDGAQRQMIFEALTRGRIRSGRLKSAILWLDRWIRELPSDIQARRWRAVVLQYQQQPHLALEDYQALQAALPDDSEVATQLGLLWAETGYDYHQAKHVLTKLVSRPDAAVRTALAVCCYGLGQQEEALVLLNQAIAQDFRYIPAWIWKSRVLLDLGHAKQAAAVARQGRALLPALRSGEQKARLLACQPPRLTHPGAYLERLLHLQVQAYQTAGQFEEAQAAAEALSKAQSARAEWNRLRETSSATPNLADLLRAAQLQLDLCDLDETENIIRQVLQVDPNYPGAMTVLQTCLDQRYQALQIQPDSFVDEQASDL